MKLKVNPTDASLSSQPATPVPMPRSGQRAGQVEAGAGVARPPAVQRHLDRAARVPTGQ